MGRHEDINNAIWSDPDFEDLSANATLLYLWSFTNPRCGMAGMYKVSLRAMTESKVSIDEVPATLAELADKGFAFYEDAVLWVRSRVKHLRARSPQMAKSVANDLSNIAPHHPLRVRFLDVYGTDSWLQDALARDGIEKVSIPSREGIEKPVGKGDSHTVSGPSRDGPGTGTGTGTGTTATTQGVQLPENFPRELRPHSKAAFVILRDLAVRHNAKPVNALSLASIVMAHSHKPLVRCAYEFAAWADSKAQRRKDVLAGYSRWLDRADDLAGCEQLTTDGLPAGTLNGVSHLSTKQDRMAAFDRVIGQEKA